MAPKTIRKISLAVQQEALLPIPGAPSRRSLPTPEVVEDVRNATMERSVLRYRKFERDVMG
jgi:hypothetical protein